MDGREYGWGNYQEDSSGEGGKSTQFYHQCDEARRNGRSYRYARNTGTWILSTSLYHEINIGTNPYCNFCGEKLIHPLTYEEIKEEILNYKDLEPMMINSFGKKMWDRWIPFLMAEVERK